MTPSSGQRAATKKKGTRCSRRAQPAGHTAISTDREPLAAPDTICPEPVPTSPWR